MVSRIRKGPSGGPLVGDKGIRRERKKGRVSLIKYIIMMITLEKEEWEKQCRSLKRIFAMQASFVGVNLSMNPDGHVDPRFFIRSSSSLTNFSTTDAFSAIVRSPSFIALSTVSKPSLQPLSSCVMFSCRVSSWARL